MQNHPNRKSPRMKGYDYSQQGAYFVTICVQNRECLFAQIENGDLKLSPAGEMVKNYWEKIPQKFPDTFIADFVVMPNHFHGIVFIEKVDGQVTLSQIIQWFKIVTKNAYIQGVKKDSWTPFIEKLWQSSFYDRIIRDEHSLDMVTAYILFNPERWVEDTLHPNNHNKK